MGKLVKLIGLPCELKVLVVRSFLWIVIVRLGLLFMKYQKLEQRLVSVSTPRRNSEINDDIGLYVERVVNSVRECSRFIPGATCLTQALVTRLLLQSAGVTSELKIGVNKTGALFEAHAWVEIGGRIVIGKVPRHGRFNVLSSASSIL
jgi:hypothetical protein